MRPAAPRGLPSRDFLDPLPTAPCTDLIAVIAEWQKGVYSRIATLQELTVGA